jgi:maleate cis-trans isomerase
MSMYYTLSGSGGAPAVTLHWQRSGVDFPTTGEIDNVADAGAQVNAVAGTTYTRTITCYSVQTNSIIYGYAFNNDTWEGVSSGAKYLTTTTGKKTVNGLAVASIKIVNGLAIASVKSIVGLA